MEDNKFALYCYFKSNLTQRMIIIWVKFAAYKTTNQRFTYQALTVIKKGWFSELEVLEIHQQIYRETNQHATNIVIETKRKSQKLLTKGKTLSNSNGNTLE